MSVAPLLGMAQDDGGRRLTFGIEQRIETDDNLGLDPVSAGRTTRADTRLSFGFHSETRTQRFSFDASGALRAESAPDVSGSDTGFVMPALNLTYGRNGPGSSFDLRAHIRETSVDFLRDLAEFDDGTGQIVLPDDLAELSGTGIRRSSGLDVTLRWGQDGPLGFRVSGGFTDLSYRDTSSPALIDSRRTRLSAGMEMRFDPATRANLDLQFSRFGNDDPTADQRDTLGLTLGLTRDLPNGSLTGKFAFHHIEEGDRLSFSLERSRELPRGSLSASLGVARAASGSTDLIGGLAMHQELPAGRIDISLRRELAAGSNDSERIVTALSLGWLHELNAVSALTLDLSHIASESSLTGAGIETTSIGATYRRSLTQDWGLDLGYRHRLRTEDTAGDAESNSIFVTLHRTFEFRP